MNQCPCGSLAINDDPERTPCDRCWRDEQNRTLTDAIQMLCQGAAIENLAPAAQRAITVQDVSRALTHLRSQRDRAWRALAQIEDALGTFDEAGLAFILTDGHDAESDEEWNAFLEAMKREEEEG